MIDQEQVQVRIALDDLCRQPAKDRDLRQNRGDLLLRVVRELVVRNAANCLVARRARRAGAPLGLGGLRRRGQQHEEDQARDTSHGARFARPADPSVRAVRHHNCPMVDHRFPPSGTAGARRDHRTHCSVALAREGRSAAVCLGLSDYSAFACRGGQRIWRPFTGGALASGLLQLGACSRRPIR